MLFFLILAQAAATPAPDIQLDLRATAREVRIERQGETSLSVRAEPDGGSETRTDKPEGDSRQRLRNVSVGVRADVRIADPQNPTEAETPSPQ